MDNPTRPTAPDLTPLSAILARLMEIEGYLNQRFLERGEIIRVLLIALIAKRHAALIGPPGTAKSELISTLTDCLSGMPLFKRQLTRLSKEEELFGPLSVQGLKADRYRRITTGMLPDAEVGFLDEVFRGGSSILNSLLLIMNERSFDNDGQRQPVPLRSLFGAANSLPEGEELDALWDRFDLRVVVPYLSDSGFERLLRLERPGGAVPTLDPSALDTLYPVIEQIIIPESVHQAFSTLRREMQGQGLVVSDRRWLLCQRLVRVHALLEGRGIVCEDDLYLLRYALWTRAAEIKPLTRAIAHVANPLMAQAIELQDQAQEIYQQAQRESTNADGTINLQAITEGAGKLLRTVKALDQLIKQAQSQGRSASRIEEIRARVASQQNELARSAFA